MKKLVLTVAVLAVAGCASVRDPDTIYVTIQSNPPGAQLSMEAHGVQMPIGPTPQVLKYQISKEARASGRVEIHPFRLQWASGAIRQIPKGFLLVGNGLDRSATFDRPQGAPNLDVDLRFAADLDQRRRRDAAEADARDRRNADAILYLGNAAVQGYNAGQASGYAPTYTQPAPSYACTSRPGLGRGTMRTECTPQ